MSQISRTFLFCSIFGFGFDFGFWVVFGFVFGERLHLNTWTYFMFKCKFLISLWVVWTYLNRKHFFMKWVSQFGFLAKCIDRHHPYMPSQVELCICSVRIEYSVFNCFAKSKITECFHKQGSKVPARELSECESTTAHIWRLKKAFQDLWKLHTPVQGTLTNFCAKVFQCSNIRRMTAMLEWWFHVKNTPCFLILRWVVYISDTKEVHYKIVGVKFVMVLDKVSGCPF